MDLVDRLREAGSEKDFAPKVLVGVVVDPDASQGRAVRRLVAGRGEDRRCGFHRDHEDFLPHGRDARGALGADDAFDGRPFEEPWDAGQKGERSGRIVAAHADDGLQAVLDTTTGAIETLAAPAEPARTLEKVLIHAARLSRRHPHGVEGHGRESTRNAKRRCHRGDESDV